MKIIIPTLGLHHDSNYFPNPEVFDPERFSDERRSTIQPGSYLPFGDGPRICIGKPDVYSKNSRNQFETNSDFLLLFFTYQKFGAANSVSRKLFPIESQEKIFWILN